MDNIFLNFWLNGGPIRGINERQYQESTGAVLRTQIENYTIDSCYTFDEGYETAIWYEDNDMVIVERYRTEEDMKIGHEKWCEFCKDNPKKVFSVQTGMIENLIEEEEEDE